MSKIFVDLSYLKFFKVFVILSLFKNIFYVSFITLTLFLIDSLLC